MKTESDAVSPSTLTIAHVAGMIDMVALPLWVGTLMRHHGYGAPQAGLAVTAFLIAVASMSFLLAPRFGRLPRFVQAWSGFAMASAAFALATSLPQDSSSFHLMLILHAAAGMGVGCALSITHGWIGRSANPHRLFALVNVALGVFAIVFLAGMPLMIEHIGPRALFQMFSVVMGVAAVVTAIWGARAQPPEPLDKSGAFVRLPDGIWWVAGAVVCLTLNQSLVFSFMERIGAARGFPPEQVNGVLIALGFVNLLPGALAALLQKRCSPLTVGLFGPIVQAVLALILSSTSSFHSYAVASALYVSVVIFSHTFLFALLTRLDPSGKAVAATPAMMMTGSCVGPALGGAVVHTVGYEGLGVVACVIAVVAVGLMLTVRQKMAQRRLSPVVVSVEASR